MDWTGQTPETPTLQVNFVKPKLNTEQLGPLASLHPPPVCGGSAGDRPLSRPRQVLPLLPPRVRRGRGNRHLLQASNEEGYAG